MKFVLLLVSVLAAQRGDDDMLARVNGAAISRGAVSRRAASAGPQARPPRVEDVLEGLIAEALLAEEGRRLGLAGSPEVARVIDRETHRAAAAEFVADLAARARPEEEMLREVFHSSADLVAFESLAFATRPEAEAAFQRISRGATLAAEARSAVVARIFPKPSEAPLAMRAELPPPLASALFGTSPGGVVGPFETGESWSIARLIKKEIGTESAFQAKREALVRFAKEQLATQARRHLLEKLKADNPVTIDESFLATLKGTDATPEQLAHVVATVKGQRIEYRDVYGSIRALGTGGGHMAGPALKIQIMQQEIEQRLLQVAAVERGYDKSPAVTELKPEIERSALAIGCADKIRASTPPPSEDEIAAFYKRNAARYGKPFKEVLPSVAANAAAQKREDAVWRRIRELRQKATVSIDRQALARAAARG